MAEVERLAVRHGLDDLAPTLAGMYAELALFDHQVDIEFEAGRKIRHQDGLDDNIIDDLLADSKFWERLAEVLRNGGPILEAMQSDGQRQAAREYVRAELAVFLRMRTGVDIDTVPHKAQRDLVPIYIRRLPL
jgi:hypothetical protein